MSAPVVQLNSINTHWDPDCRMRRWVDPGENFEVGRCSAAYRVHRVGDEYECELTAFSPGGWRYDQIRFLAVVYPVDMQLYLPSADRLLIVRAIEIGRDRPERMLLEIVDLASGSIRAPGREV